MKLRAILAMSKAPNSFKPESEGEGFADPDGFLWEVAWNPKFPHV